MKSYCVTKLPDNVKYIRKGSNTQRMVFCFMDDVCVHSRLMSTYEEADAFGLEYLDMDWNLYGFPPLEYRVSNFYLDQSRNFM